MNMDTTKHDSPISIGETITTKVEGFEYSIRRVYHNYFVWSLIKNGAARVGYADTYFDSAISMMSAQKSWGK